MPRPREAASGGRHRRTSGGYRAAAAMIESGDHVLLSREAGQVRRSEVTGSATAARPR